MFIYIHNTIYEYIRKNVIIVLFLKLDTVLYNIINKYYNRSEYIYRITVITEIIHLANKKLWKGIVNG